MLAMTRYPFGKPGIRTEQSTAGMKLLAIVSRFHPISYFRLGTGGGLSSPAGLDAIDPVAHILVAPIDRPHLFYSSGIHVWALSRTLPTVPTLSNGISLFCKFTALPGRRPQQVYRMRLESEPGTGSSEEGRQRQRSRV